MNRLFEVFQQNERRATLAAQVIVLLMMTCVNYICVMAAGRVSAAYAPQGVMLFGFLVTAEALYSCRLIKNLPASDDRKPYYRLTEWVVILLLLKVFTEIRFGFDHFLQNVMAWPKSFAESFFTLNFLFNILIVLILWASTTLFALDLLKLEDDVAYIKGHITIGDDQRKSARASLRERYLAIGALVVFLAGIMRQSQFALSGAAPASENIVALVLLYFLLGLVLLSLAHFANLRAVWGYEQVSIQKNMASRWILYCAVFLAGLVLVVLLLPTNYSMGLFATIRFLFNWLFVIVKYLFILLLFPFYWFFRLIGSLFGKSPGEPVQPIQPPQMEFQPPPETPTPLPGWEIFKSVMFWIVFLAIIIFAFRQYIQTNRKLAETLRRLRVWRWLADAWTWIQAQFRSAGRGVSALVEAGIRRLRNLRASATGPDRWQFLNPRRLQPRQKVIFFYLAMLRRAGEAGTPRQPWQTPDEFSGKLKAAVPDETDDIAALTDSFLDARYSPRDVTPERADQTRTIWERLVSVLRARGRGGKNF